MVCSGSKCYRSWAGDDGGKKSLTGCCESGLVERDRPTSRTQAWCLREGGVECSTHYQCTTTAPIEMCKEVEARRSSSGCIVRRSEGGVVRQVMSG